MSTSEHASPPRVLRVPRSDEPDSYVLLHVARTNTAALDLNLTATEGEFPYNGVVRQARAQTHRSKSYQGTDEDWVLILLRALGQLEINTDNSDLLSGIELSASIKGQALKQDDEQAIQLFDWSAVAVARADMLEQQLLNLQRHYHEADSTIEQLNKQIEEFISAKRRHEEQLMTNFTQVLNQKKLKIRNQQRLLASAKIDVDDAGKHQAVSSKVGARVGSKKHAKRPIVETSDDDAESDNGSESLDQTKPQTSPGRISDTDDEPNSTPQPLEDVDNTTDEDSPTTSGIDQGHQQDNAEETAGETDDDEL
ncbi:hypothetical protein BO79DRAFT_135056 [Aspergillus costaricaensis CBS 115574]|uniref:Uncharacterized protein n=1 Tax=Aspergillus costaricaensis CBS 115574 TaxID=1448317 RepID=A0ACD1IVC1_9EURO|nr:hypothetical protein BO79DRAFT_135056 [Aspergillus costaricaensis CBS 115574]RAK94591.1 hypothetical protein BO79DRAFT_135056 [Aspergillus costaricaensis CBS 115574]